MIYPYHCDSCDRGFEVVKPAADSSRIEKCYDCMSDARRVWTVTLLSGTSVTHAEFNPAFGAVVKNKRHKEYLAAKKNMIEVGNDFNSGDSMQKHFDTERAVKKERMWEED